MKKRIVQTAHDLGFISCRVTTADPISSDQLTSWIGAGCHGDMRYMARNPEKRCDPKALLPEAKSIICCALPYGECGITPEISTFPGPSLQRRGEKRARFARGADYHVVIREKLKTLVKLIQARVPDAKTRCCVDTSPILEKAIAARAGIGWTGKHTLLVNPNFGSWFVLGEIITDIELEPDGSIENLCNDCTKCIDLCPTKALQETSLDARKCISYLTIECKDKCDCDSYGCDVCQEACPYNSN